MPEQKPGLLSRLFEPVTNLFAGSNSRDSFDRDTFSGDNDFKSPGKRIADFFADIFRKAGNAIYPAPSAEDSRRQMESASFFRVSELGPVHKKTTDRQQNPASRQQSPRRGGLDDGASIRSASPNSPRLK